MHEKLNIAVYGGVFDPIHIEHLDVIKELQEKYDRVLVVPTGNPPSKTPKASAAKRFRWVCDAVEDLENVWVTDIEMGSGVSYTINTLLILREIYPMDNLFLVFGTDQYQKFLNGRGWARQSDIKKLATVVAHTRPDDSVSSTAIRRELEIDRVELVKDLVPVPVYESLKEDNVYAILSKVQYP